MQLDPYTVDQTESVQQTIKIKSQRKRLKRTRFLEIEYLHTKTKFFKILLQKFGTFAKTKKIEYQNHNDWWEAGKLYFKTITTAYRTKINQHINKKQESLMNYIFQEKSKLKPYKKQIDKYQQDLEEIENYKN